MVQPPGGGGFPGQRTTPVPDLPRPEDVPVLRRAFPAILGPLERARLTAESRVVPFFQFGPREPFLDLEFKFFTEQLKGAQRKIVEASIPGLSRGICLLLNCSEKDVSTTVAETLGTSIAGAHVFLTMLVSDTPTGVAVLDAVVDFEIGLAIGRDRLGDIRDMASLIIDPVGVLVNPIDVLTGLLPGGTGAAARQSDKVRDQILRKLDKAAATIIKNRRKAPTRR